MKQGIMNEGGITNYNCKKSTRKIELDKLSSTNILLREQKTS